MSSHNVVKEAALRDALADLLRKAADLEEGAAQALAEAIAKTSIGQRLLKKLRRPTEVANIRKLLAEVKKEWEKAQKDQFISWFSWGEVPPPSRSSLQKIIQKRSELVGRLNELRPLKQLARYTKYGLRGGLGALGLGTLGLSGLGLASLLGGGEEPKPEPGFFEEHPYLGYGALAGIPALLALLALARRRAG